MGCVSSLLGRKVRLTGIPIIPNPYDTQGTQQLSALVNKVGEVVAVDCRYGSAHMALMIPGEKKLISTGWFEYEILPPEIPGYDPGKAMLDYQVRTGQV